MQYNNVQKIFLKKFAYVSKDNGTMQASDSYSISYTEIKKHNKSKREQTWSQDKLNCNHEQFKVEVRLYSTVSTCVLPGMNTR